MALYLAITLILSALFAGFAIAWFASKSRYSKGRSSFLASISNLNSEKEKLELMVGTAQRELNEERDKNITLVKNIASLETSRDHLLQQLQDQKDSASSIERKLAQEFELLAGKIIEEKSHKMSKLQNDQLHSILSPLKDRINNFEKRIEQSHKESIDRHAGLKQMVYDMKELGIKMSEDAHNLAKALKGDSRLQGNWGEMILEKILEKSGLVKGREYSVQESITVDGRRLRPDVIINLPEEKKIVVDSKVTLTAYEKYVAETDIALKQGWLKEHYKSFKNHINNLSSKEYDKIYEIKSPDFVLMFIPIEPAFSLAIKHFPELYDYAFERNIIIVGPSTLLATLMTVSSIWKQEYQNENVLEIARESGMLYDKFVGFVSDLSEVGKKLDSSKKSFERAMNKLSIGTGNLVRRAEKIKELGAKTKKELPKDLINKAKEGEQLEIN